jgi:guanosine-3',5'-bis(diphosphate) 3'-pyrophosphohydrolase
MEVVQKAMVFALKAHKGQVRKGTGLPYFVHPMEVLSQIGDWGINDEEIWAAAILHDVMEENHKVTKAMLSDNFSPKVVSLVEELTFIPPREITQSNIKALKQQYLDGFGSKSVSALIIKIADRCVNTCDFFTSSPDYAPKYWRKAEGLFEVMSNRRHEIIEAFGGEESGVFPRIKYTHTTICQMVA